MHNSSKSHTSAMPEGISGRRRRPRNAYGVQRARVVGRVSYRGPNGHLQTVPPGVCRVEPEADGYRLTWTVDRVTVSIVMDPQTYGEYLARKHIRPL